ncbi:hypothetical protein [Mycoplasmopsis agalactiae]|uniref:hypothetical protein n=1 Tax=Mycoplasmopsis agalactiae TaxID=2110 RepID=UPI001F17E840|nr:hypothetical protein [Mycoplasmopsis agalactiae]
MTLANGQEITFTFTDERERMAQDTDASGADINSGTRSVQPSGATQPGKPGASTQPSGSAQ